MINDFWKVKNDSKTVGIARSEISIIRLLKPGATFN